MCGRVVQVSDPIRLSIVEGLNVRDTRLSNYPRRWNGAPSQELLVIREERGPQDQRTLARSSEMGPHPLLADSAPARHLGRIVRVRGIAVD